MSAPAPTPIPLTTVAELRQHHSQLVRLGLASHPAHARRLLSFLARDPDSGLPYAARLLAHHPDPHPALLNPLFSALPPRHAARLLALMLSLPPLRPDHFTFPRILPAAAPLHLVAQLHALLLKLGYHAHTQSLNALLAAYFANARPDLASRVFRGGGAADLDVVSWTTMVGGLCKLGLVDEARELFDAMPERNLVSWNAMMSGYVKAGRFLDALEVLDEMRARGVDGNGFLAATAVVACTGAGALARGREVHRWVERSGVEVDDTLAAALVDMYCKCGCVDEAWRVFESLPPAKGLTTWNCMIGGFAVHGRGEDAVRLFGRMEQEGVAPDDVTLVNVLTACAHTGMLGEGRRYFDGMVPRYGIEPKMEHYGCMVDLYGRAGRLDEARKLIEGMPMEPDVGVLGALFGACRIHGDVDLGEAIGRRVIELDPQNSGRYVLLANLLATAGRWEDVVRVRRLMDERNVSKEAGRSVIEVGGEVREFQCGGMCGRVQTMETEEVYAMARDMLRRIGAEGYVPDTRDVLHDVAEEEKETPLLYHSEKLAIAFGLLRTRPGDSMRITKNLRVCRDCHEVTKFVSRVFERDIVVRDRNRFHHFKDGKCSCKDYW